ncbi:MAG: DUF2892 domain-containing protein [Planctomycetaceae bacterium]
MPNSLERKASALNGLIIVCACAMGAFETTRLWGISIAIFMGAGLIFSGWANFCGWYRILSPRGSKQTGHAPFWIGGREAHRKGLNTFYGTQISEATKLANESTSEVEKNQHLDAVNRLRAEHRSKLEQADHALY